MPPALPQWLAPWAAWVLKGRRKGDRPAGVPARIPKPYLFFPAFCLWQQRGRIPAQRPAEVPARVPQWARDLYPAVAALIAPAPVPPPSRVPQLSLYVDDALQREAGHGFAVGAMTEQQLADRCAALNRPGGAIAIQAKQANEPHYPPLRAELDRVGWRLHLWGIIPDPLTAAAISHRAGAACYRAQTEGADETDPGFVAAFEAAAPDVELRTVTTGGAFWPTRAEAVQALEDVGGDPASEQQVNNTVVAIARDRAHPWAGLRVDFEAYANEQPNLTRDAAFYVCQLLGWPLEQVTPLYGAYKGAAADGTDLAIYEPVGDDFGVYLADTLSEAGWAALRR